MKLSREEQDLKDERDYREAEQEQIDNLAEAKRAASGFSPEQLAIQDAYHEGCRAGNQGVQAGCNPFADPLSEEFRAWERGRSAAEAQRLSRYLPKRAAA